MRVGTGEGLVDSSGERKGSRTGQECRQTRFPSLDLHSLCFLFLSQVGRPPSKGSFETRIGRSGGVTCLPFDSEPLLLPEESLVVPQPPFVFGWMTTGVQQSAPTSTVSERVPRPRPTRYGPYVQTFRCRDDPRTGSQPWHQRDGVGVSLEVVRTPT